MDLEVLDFENKLLKKINIKCLKVESIRYDLIRQLILWQQSKKRCAISNTKEISAVRGSTRKIYRQKGTGRARHGSVRGAQFVGGGIIFGPSKDKVYKYKINKKVRKIALLNALALKYNNKSIIVYKDLTPKTNKAKDFLKMYSNNFLSKKILLIDNHFDDSLVKATRNIYRFNRLNVKGINVLDLISHEKIYFSEEAFNIVIERFEQ